MSVQQGLYLLMVGDNHIPIGRYYIEDRSLLPKRVLSLPQGSQPPQWVILKNDSGKYVLKADGAPVFIKNNLIYADLLGDQATQKWDITPAGADGRYNISQNGQYFNVGPTDPPTTQVSATNSANSAFFLIRIDN